MSWTTSFTEPGLTLFNILHRTAPSTKLALNSSSEAFIGKLRLGRILFNHSTNTARCLAAKDEKDKSKTTHSNKLKKKNVQKNQRHRISASCTFSLRITVCHCFKNIDMQLHLRCQVFQSVLHGDSALNSWSDAKKQFFRAQLWTFGSSCVSFIK